MGSSVELCIQLVSAVAAFLAAVFWFKSAKVRIPDEDETVISQMFAPFRKAADLNAKAAVCAAAAAILQAILVLFS